MLWRYIERSVVPVESTASVLHFAPEANVASLLRRRLRGRYVAVDIRPQFHAALDITALPFREGTFDVVLCCHVLEHVPDDRAAIRELRRILAPGGQLVVQVPMTPTGVTDEDPSLPAPERIRRFGQKDHVRLYGLDLSTRLEEALFDVTVLRSADVLQPDPGSFAVPEDETLFCCRVS